MPSPVFGIFSPETVHFVDMREALVTFLTKRQKKVGQTLKVRFGMKGLKPPRLDLTLRVTHSRPAQSGKGFICVGVAVVVEEKLPELEDMLRGHAERGDLGISGRRSQRLPVSLKVMARELPGFTAVTVDISMHGVRLNCHGAVRQGTMVHMTVESDVASVDNMSLRGRIIWARENTLGRGWLAGIEFAELPAAQIDNLERYSKALAARLKGDVMHRQIADGEFTVRSDEAEEAPSQSTLPPPPPSGMPPLPPPPGLPPLPPPPPPRR